MPNLAHIYGVRGYRRSKMKELGRFSNVCFAGIDHPNMTMFDLICPNPLINTDTAAIYHTMMYNFLKDAVMSLGPEHFELIRTGKKSTDPYIVRMHAIKGKVFRTSMLMPGTIFRYTTEHPSVVWAYDLLRQAKMPRELALSLCVSVWAVDDTGKMITCAGGRGTGHSLRLVKINSLDSKYRLKECWKQVLELDWRGEQATAFVPDGCVITHYRYCVGGEVPGYLRITEDWVQEKLKAHKMVMQAAKGKQKAPKVPKDLFDVNYVLDDGGDLF